VWQQLCYVGVVERAIFEKVHRSCVANFEEFIAEARKMLNLLRATAHPASIQERIALQEQRVRESDAHGRFARCRQELFDIVNDRSRA